MTPDAMTEAKTEPQAPVAIVTGGSRGIGKAIVERLARAGLDVHFTYVSNEQAATALVDELRARGLHARSAARVDSRDAAAVAGAGRTRRSPSADSSTCWSTTPPSPPTSCCAMMSDQEWTSVLDTSLNGLFGASRPTARQMMRQRSGRIINLTSVSGVIGIAGQTNYSAAKAAIIGFTRSLAKEMAPWGVCVNAVAPGFVDTDMLAGFTPRSARPRSSACRCGASPAPTKSPTWSATSRCKRRRS